MGYFNDLYKIYRGIIGGDNSGTPARTAAQGINENMDRIDAALEAIDTASEKNGNKAQNLFSPNHIKYPTSMAVVEALAAQVFFTTDGNFTLDENKVLRGNVSTYKEEFTWQAGAQIFPLAFEPTNFLFIMVQGALIFDSQYNFLPPKELQIIDTLGPGNSIQVVYEHFIIQP